MVTKTVGTPQGTIQRDYTEADRAREKQIETSLSKEEHMRAMKPTESGASSTRPTDPASRIPTTSKQMPKKKHTDEELLRIISGN